MNLQHNINQYSNIFINKILAPNFDSIKNCVCWQFKIILNKRLTMFL